MKQKTALVTGATSGIGKAIAIWLARQNYRLILCGRRQEILEKLKQQLAPADIFCLDFDVRNAAEVSEKLASLPADFQQVDILINNAGNAHGLDELDTAELSDWDAMLDTNVKGLLYVSQPIIQKMKTQKSGHIINISSVAARQVYQKVSVYCASKKAVDAISEGMRLELTEFGIRVTNIQPGAVETEFSMVRFKNDEQRAKKVYEGFRPLLAEDIADAVGYCLSVPERVSIAEMLILPRAQAEGRTIHRNMGL